MANLSGGQLSMLSLTSVLSLLYQAPGFSISLRPVKKAPNRSKSKLSSLLEALRRNQAAMREDLSFCPWKKAPHLPQRLSVKPRNYLLWKNKTPVQSSFHQSQTQCSSRALKAAKNRPLWLLKSLPWMTPCSWTA